MSDTSRRTDDFLHRSAASPGGEVAAFIASSGDLRIVILRPPPTGQGLEMVLVPNVEAKIHREEQQEQQSDRAGRVGIREVGIGGKDFLVVAADRYGKISVTEIMTREAARGKLAVGTSPPRTRGSHDAQLTDHELPHRNGSMGEQDEEAWTPPELSTSRTHMVRGHL